MFKFSVLIVALVAFSAANGGRLPKADPMDRLVDLINQANLYTGKEGSVLRLPRLTLELLFVKVSLDHGSIGNFSTFALIGDDQVLNERKSEGRTVLDFDIHLGPKEFYVQNDLSYSLIIYIFNSRVKICFSDLGLRMAGSLISVDNDMCSFNLDTAEVTGLSDFQVTFTPDGNTNNFPKRCIHYFVKVIVPVLKLSGNLILRYFTHEGNFNTELAPGECKMIL